MKRFIIHILLFGVFSVCLLLPIEFYKIKNYSYISKVNAYEVYRAVLNSHKKKKVKRLIIGDSVGQQLYPNELSYDSIMSLACTATTSVAGMYFLAEMFIETNQDQLPEVIILLITPFSLGCDLEAYTYQYFLKPFPMREYKKYYNKHLEDRVKSIPFYYTANLPFIQTSSFSPSICVPKEQPYGSFSQISYDYLQKIDSLAKVNGVEFRMISTPIRDDRKEDFEQWKQGIDANYYAQLQELLDSYISTVAFAPAEDYQDDAHFIYTEKPQRISKIPVDYLHILSN